MCVCVCVCDPVDMMVNYIFFWFCCMRVFQLAQIFERKYKATWKVHASAPTINTGRQNFTQMDSCLITSLIE